MKSGKSLKTKKALLMLAALAQESRLAIFKLLIAEGEAGLAAGTISERLDIPATTLSFHLSQLKSSGLIKSHKDGRSVIYVAKKKQAKKLANFLTEKEPAAGQEEMVLL